MTMSSSRSSASSLANMLSPSSGSAADASRSRSDLMVTLPPVKRLTSVGAESQPLTPGIVVKLARPRTT